MRMLRLREISCVQSCTANMAELGLKVTSESNNVFHKLISQLTLLASLYYLWPEYFLYLTPSGYGCSWVLSKITPIEIKNYMCLT